MAILDPCYRAHAELPRAAAPKPGTAKQPACSGAMFDEKLQIYLIIARAAVVVVASAMLALAQIM